MKGALGVLLLASLLSGCGSADRRDRDLKQLRASLSEKGFRSRLVDRDSGLIGPPEIKPCDPPLIAARRNDSDQQHGRVTIYVCPSAAQARRATVPAAFPGARVIRSNVIAVVDGDAAFGRDVRRALYAAIEASRG